MAASTHVACLLVSLLVGTHSAGGQRYHNAWAVEVRGGPDVADRLARRHGFVCQGKIGDIRDYYHFVLENASASRIAPQCVTRLRSEKEVGFIEQQLVRRRVKRDYHVPTDPEWLRQWSLKNTGSVADGSQNMDLRVEAAWIQNLDGTGVVTAVVDDGVEKAHSDLTDNYDPGASWDFSDGDDDPTPSYSDDSNSHGTNCAGEIAMAKNSLCGIGVAYRGKIGGLRLNLAESSDLTEANALSYKTDFIEIYTNSWGPPDYGFVVEGPGHITELMLKSTIQQGRNGKGSIYVWASGNGGKYYDSCAADGYVSSIYTIAVGSADQMGNQAYYDESCSSKMAVTYSYNSGASKKQITTTTLHGKCTNSFTGSSASGPLVAGTIALTLQANSNLTWRDIQYLIAYTSDPTRLAKGDWVVNGGGRSVSHRFGFGAIDAEAMVTRAKRWILVPQQQSTSVLPSNSCLCDATSERPSTFSFVVDSHSPVHFVEHVVLRATLQVQGVSVTYGMTALCNFLAPSSCEALYDRDSLFGSTATDQQLYQWLSRPHPRRGDIQVELTSPRGTNSVLLPYRNYDFVNDEGYTNWPFMSVHYWGEDPVGTWNATVRFKSTEGNASVRDVTLTLYGAAETPLAVSGIPASCDPMCSRGCSREGPDGCDACTTGYFRDAVTLKCLEKCPPKTTAYNSYCVHGAVVLAGGEVLSPATIGAIVSTVVCAVVLIGAVVILGTCLYRRRKRVQPVHYAALSEAEE